MIKSPEPNQVSCLQLQELVLHSLPASMGLCNVLDFIDLQFYFVKRSFEMKVWC